MASERLLEPGDLLGRYRAGPLIGAGGMGQVFLAEDLQTGHDVALKLLHPRWAGDDWLVELFHKEAALVRSLSHANLVALLQVGEDRGLHYLVFEFIHGVSLEHVLRDGPMEVALAASIIQDLAMGLSAAHAAGVVHRDLKPANVMITPDDRIKLIDFGVADRSGAGTGDREIPRELDGPGSTGVCGTRVYSAPEQNQGRPASPAADVYSLGAVAYELFSGRRLYLDGELQDVLRAQAGLQVLLDKDTPLHARMPEPIDRVVRRMLQLLPADRYASAQEILPDLEAAIREVGAVPRDALARSKRTALADLAETLLLRAQDALAKDDLEIAADLFARILSLEPPNRDNFVRSIRRAVEAVFWKSSQIGPLPVRLLGLLDELGLKDLRFLVEHRLASSIRGTPDTILERLDLYLLRWPNSVAFLRAASAVARAVAPERRVDLLLRLSEALLGIGEKAAAARALLDAKAGAEAGHAPGIQRVEALLQQGGTQPAGMGEAFHRTVASAAELVEPIEQASLWDEFLEAFGEWSPALIEAARAHEKAGNRIRASRLCARLGMKAFVAGATREARRWFEASVRLDPDRDEGLLYLAEISGGVPEGQNIRVQRVALLRRLGLAEAALYHREKDLTGGESDASPLEQMADIAEEWRLDPAPFLLRRARIELNAGRDEAAEPILVEALRRARNPADTAARILALPGAVRALGSARLAEIRELAGNPASTAVPTPETLVPGSGG